MDVARRNRLDPELVGKRAERGEPSRVATLVGALQLDEEALSPERLREPGRGRRVAERDPEARATGETHDPFPPLDDVLERDGGWQQHSMLLPGRPRAGMREGEDAAEVRVALTRLDEQREVRAVFERDLGAGERPDAERLGGMGELERPVHAVVVGERECGVVELGRTRGELLGM